MKNSDAVMVTGRVSKDDANLADAFADSHRISRSQVVADAIRHYVHSKECILCGSLNHPDGKKCSVCGACLFDDNTINEVLKKLGVSDTYADNEDNLPRHLLEMSIDTYNACRESGLTFDLTPIIDRKITPSQYACEIQFVLNDNVTRLKLVSDAHISIPREVLYVGLLDNKYGDGNLFKRICCGEAGESELRDFVYEISGITDFNYNAVLDFLLK